MLFDHCATRPTAPLPPTPSPSPVPTTTAAAVAVRSGGAGGRDSLPSPTVASLWGPPPAPPPSEEEDGARTNVELEVEVEAGALRPHPEEQQYRVRDLLNRTELNSIEPFDRYNSVGYAYSRSANSSSSGASSTSDGGTTRDAASFADAATAFATAPLLAPSLEHAASATTSSMTPAFTEQEQFEQLEHVVSGLVAHEIAMDPRYRLTLPVNHEQGLEFALLARRIARDSTDVDAVAAVVADLRRGLLCATTAHGGSGHDRLRERIRSNLDPALLASQVAHCAFDQTEVFEFVVDIVQLVCAPARDQEVAELASVKHSFVPFVLQARGLLHRMHEDILNYNLRSMRPAVVEFAVEVERATVLPFFMPTTDVEAESEAESEAETVTEHGRNTKRNVDVEDKSNNGVKAEPPVHLHEKTRKWIQRGCTVLTATATDASGAAARAPAPTPAAARASAARRPTASEVVVEAVVELVMQHGPAAVACPETCELDNRRIVAWRKAAALSNLASSVHTIVRSAVPIGWGPKLVNDVMRTIIVLPLVAAATTAAGVFAPATLAAVADATVALLQGYRAAVERPWQSFAGHAQLIRALAGTYEAAGDSAGHPVRRLLDQRARGVLRTALLHGVAPTHPTPGLEASHGILNQMASEILVFYRHNCRVFGELYASLIAAEQ